MITWYYCTKSREMGWCMSGSQSSDFTANLNVQGRTWSGMREDPEYDMLREEAAIIQRGNFDVLYIHLPDGVNPNEDCV